MSGFLPASVDTDFAVVLTGAGISRDAPSNLPSAGMLAEHVWKAVRDSLPGVIDSRLDAKIRRRVGGVRMEQFLELLTKKGTIPTAIVVDVYRLVGGAAFNENHMRIAALRAHQFTLNMDTLIEDAGPGVTVTHLHGLWNQPKSIRTTVTHYSEGLRRELRDRFVSAIEGKKVLVIGYSGRDTDVISLIERHPPKHLVWVGPNLAKWEYEVVQLRERYDRGDFGADYMFEPQEKNAGEYLPLLVARVPKPSGLTRPHPATGLRERLERETTPPQRMIAVGRLLFDFGLDDELQVFFDAHQFRGGLEIERRKIIARSLARQGKPDKALERLREPPARLSEVGPWLRNATEIDALERRASTPAPDRRFWRSVLAVMTLVPLPAFRRPRMLAQIRRAKRLAVAGNTREAIRITGRVTTSPRVQSILGDDSLVDALTWEADALKSWGSLNRALEVANRADRLGFYGNPGQAAYAKWKLGEIRAAAGPGEGDDPAAYRSTVRKLFDDALTLATQVHNNDTLAWIHGTYAEFVVDDDPRGARRHLAAAARLGAAASSRSAFGRVYYLLQCAVVEMTAGQLTKAAALIDNALGNERGHHIPGARLQAQQLREEIRWRQNRTYDLVTPLLGLADEFRDIDMLLSEARARVIVAALRAEQVPDRLMERARSNGWNELLQHAEGRSGYYPWRWSILL